MKIQSTRFRVNNYSSNDSRQIESKNQIRFGESLTIELPENLVKVGGEELKAVLADWQSNFVAKAVEMFRADKLLPKVVGKFNPKKILGGKDVRARVTRYMDYGNHATITLTETNNPNVTGIGQVDGEDKALTAKETFIAALQQFLRNRIIHTHLG